MSRMKWRLRNGFLGAVVFALSSWAIPRPMGSVAAQTTEGDSLQEALGSRLEHLLAVRADLARRRVRTDSILRAAGRAKDTAPLDTFEVGPLRLVTEASQRGFAEKMFQEAWAEAGPAFQGSEDLLEPWTWVIRIGRDARERTAAKAGGFTVEVVSSPGLPKELYSGMAFRAIGGVLEELLPPEVVEWVGPKPLAASETLPWAARELVTTPSTAARRCYRGELDSCRSALGLVPEEKGWEAWYTREERRGLIEREGRPRFSADGAGLWDQCVEARAGEACDLLLEGRPPTPPLANGNRAALLTVALRMGGDGAARRLLAPEAMAMEDRLSRVAGVPGDSVLAEWRREVLSAAPSVWAGVGLTPVGALVWFVLFAFLAARSTRWRLG